MTKRGTDHSKNDVDLFGFLLNMAGSAALNHFAHKYESGNKVNPYAAASTAYSLGQLKSTEDLLKLGGALGAMGAFDSNEEEEDARIGEDYGVYRENFGTHEEYMEALHDVGYDSFDSYEDEEFDSFDSFDEYEDEDTDDPD